MLDAEPKQAAAALPPAETGSAPLTVDTGLGDLDGILAPLQPAASTVNTSTDTGEPEDAGDDLDARIAALLLDKPMTDWNAVSTFMANVVAWPASLTPDAGYINLHYSMGDKKDPTKLVKGLGWPYQSIDQFVKRAGWIASGKAAMKDVWFCTSRQSKTGVGTAGKTKAVRFAANAMAQKSIWIDLDVGPSEPGKKPKYATIEDALKAVLLFAKTVDLPDPSAIVFSGSGVHVYWISKTELTPAEWQPYASGLKNLLLANSVLCDAGLTTDIARILRVPGTFNHKTTPPKPVQLATLPLVMYDFEHKLGFLKQFAGPITATPSAKEAFNPFAEGADMASFKRRPILAADPNDTLGAGIDRHEDVLLDPRPIFQQCGFYKEALRTGGADYDNALWMYSVLGTTFMENGNAIAHEISKGHASYSEVDTQKEYDRKVVDRADRGIGYPSCSTIAGAGCKSCASCPLFAKGKSPLNIRPEFTATVNPTTTPPVEASFVAPYAEFVGPEFPLEILPPTLAKFVDAEHRAMGADPSAIAMAALTVVAGAMNAETQVRVGDGWWERPIFWTCLLGPPSSMKSPILKKATEPLSRIDHERGKFWKKQYAAWLQTPNRKLVPTPAQPARCVINDATPEKVAEVLSRDPSGALMVHDELAGWLGGFERYNTGSSSRALFLSSWNGGTFLKDRVGKGRADPDAEVHVDNLALSILGGIQPDRLMELGNLTSDGLLQRFLPVLMKSAKLGDPEYPVAVVEAEYEKLIRSINALPARNYHFADEACEVRDDVFGYLHRLEQVDGFSASLIGAIGKLRGYFARICLALHVARTQEPLALPEGNWVLADAFSVLDPSESLGAGVNVNAAIPREIAEAAKKLVLEFLLPHMMGLYDVVVNGGQDRDKLQTIANFILASDKDRLRPSDVNAGVRALRGQPEQKIREWVGRFCSMDWLTPEEGKLSVPAKAWLVAPGLRDHFSERRKQAAGARAEMHAILKAGGSRRSR
jgi:Protein of unknown function (DUF3987)